jgi:chemotaxis protein MotB
MAGGGGAWKVAYADFVTAMMAFFLVMWITSQDDKIKEAIAQHFNEPDSMFEQFDGTEGANSGSARRGKKHSPKDAGGNGKKKYSAPKPRAINIHDSDRPGIETVLFFSNDSPLLDAESQQQLQDFVKVIAGKPQKVEIRGHASRRPLKADSPYKDAWQLSYARCIATMDVLTKQGIPLERIRLSQAGKFEPYRSTNGPQTYLQDPRVEVFLLNETVQDFARTPRVETGLSAAH